MSKMRASYYSSPTGSSVLDSKQWNGYDIFCFEASKNPTTSLQHGRQINQRPEADLSKNFNVDTMTSCFAAQTLPRIKRPSSTTLSVHGHLRQQRPHPEQFDSVNTINLHNDIPCDIPCVINAGKSPVMYAGRCQNKGSKHTSCIETQAHPSHFLRDKRHDSPFSWQERAFDPAKHLNDGRTIKPLFSVGNYENNQKCTAGHYGGLVSRSSRKRQTSTSKLSAQEKYDDDDDVDDLLGKLLLSFSYPPVASNSTITSTYHRAPTPSLDERLPTAQFLTSYCFSEEEEEGVDKGDLTQEEKYNTNITQHCDHAEEHQHPPHEQKLLPALIQQLTACRTISSAAGSIDKKNSQNRQQEQPPTPYRADVTTCDESLISSATQASSYDESTGSRSCCSEEEVDTEFDTVHQFHERGSSMLMMVTTTTSSCPRPRPRAEPVLQNRNNNAKYQDMVSGYVKAVFKELVFVTYDEMDANHKRSKCHVNTKIGFPGLACRHCLGRPVRKEGIQLRSGRYFPKSFKTIKDIRTTNRIFSHLVGCPTCPLHIKHNLMSLSKEAHHLYEHDEMKNKHPGAWTLFFADIWARLLRDEKEW